MEITIQNITGGIKINGIRDFDLESILECGQCFRWDKNDANDYTGIAAGRVVRAKQYGDVLTLYNTGRAEFESFWFDYFDLATDYSKIKRTLSAIDPIMEKAVEHAPGIRLLRQPVFETLISFIVSANNSIPNIRRIISALSEMWGGKIYYGENPFYSFPESSVLAKQDIDDLKLTKAGYRCEYIKKTSSMFIQNPISAGELANMDYFDAKKQLMQFPGAGAKVADCTILFTGSHFNAFPVDVWIKKIMEELYIGKKTALGKINEYAYNKFGNLAGYAQQYLFHYIRTASLKEADL